MLDDQRLNLRSCTADDVDDVRQFVASCAPLEVHTAFTYWVTFEHWGDICFVLLEDGRIAGYVSAIGSDRHRETIYLWQIGVAEKLRHQGVAQHLISAVSSAAVAKGYKTAQVSIANDNEASRKAFEHYAANTGHRFRAIGEMSIEDSFSGELIQETCFELTLASRAA
jgi:L-2,4-diaminobutyric acid acetyltransferase